MKSGNEFFTKSSPCLIVRGHMIKTSHCNIFISSTSALLIVCKITARHGSNIRTQQKLVNVPRLLEGPRGVDYIGQPDVHIIV